MARAFVIAWEFLLKQGHEAKFIEAYGPEGRWTKLFRKAPGYVRSELARSEYDGHKYVTVDVWETRAAYDAFRKTHEAEYDLLDTELRECTVNEQRIGSYYLE
jgi:heme-degrading monooxygenase HmoA